MKLAEWSKQTGVIVDSDDSMKHYISDDAFPVFVDCGYDEENARMVSDKYFNLLWHLEDYIVIQNSGRIVHLKPAEHWLE